MQTLCAVGKIRNPETGKKGKKILSDIVSRDSLKSKMYEVIVVIYNYESGSSKTASIWNNKKEREKIREVLKNLKGIYDYGTGCNPSGSMDYYKIPKENVSGFKKEIRSSYRRRNKDSPNKSKVLFPSKKDIDEGGNLTGKYFLLLGKDITA